MLEVCYSPQGGATYRATWEKARNFGPSNAVLGPIYNGRPAQLKFLTKHNQRAGSRHTETFWGASRSRSLTSFHAIFYPETAPRP
jgi:hypothetical protein